MELVRMRDIPPRERAVDRGGDLPEGVGCAYQKIATGRLGQRLAGLPNEDDAKDQPTTHVRMALGVRFARRAHGALRPPLGPFPELVAGDLEIANQTAQC